MEIKRNGSQPSRIAPAENFTGNVRVDPLFDAPAPARALGAYVTFEPGARTAWHTHPLGQNLIVVSGFGWVLRWGGPREEIRPGDVGWFAPGEKHWHGATATATTTHYRRARSPQRLPRRLAGTRQRRTIWRLTEPELASRSRSIHNA